MKKIKFFNASLGVLEGVIQKNIYKFFKASLGVPWRVSLLLIPRLITHNGAGLTENESDGGEMGSRRSTPLFHQSCVKKNCLNCCFERAYTRSCKTKTRKDTTKHDLFPQGNRTARTGREVDINTQPPVRLKLLSKQSEAQSFCSRLPCRKKSEP